MSGPTPRLGEVLVEAGAITREQLGEALREQSSWGGRLGQNLLSMGYVDEATLVGAVARQLQLQTVDLDQATLPPGVTQLLSVTVAERYGMMPLGTREPRVLMIACFDPTNEEGLRAARMAASMDVECWVAPATAVDRAIRRHYYGEAPSAAVGANPLFNITRNSFEREQAPASDRRIDERVADLERKLEALNHTVQQLVSRMR